MLLASRFWWYGVAILLGLFVGYADWPLGHAVATLCSDVFVRLFKCVSLPIIALSVLVTIASHHLDGSMRRLGRRTLLYTFSTTLVAAFISYSLYRLIQPVGLSPNEVVQASVPMHALSGGYWQHVAELIPDNLFTPFMKQHVMGVLLISVSLGFAVHGIHDVAVQITVVNLFKGLHRLMMVIVSWIIQAMPLALFGLE